MSQLTRWTIGFAAAAALIGLVAPVAAGEDTADLAISKKATYPTVRMGGIVTYTVSVTNLGPGAASDVVFGDSMPDQLNLVDSTCGSASAFCTVASLPVGATATMWIIGVPITNLAPEERSLSNTAFIASSGTADPRLDNNQASDVVDVVGALKPCANPGRVCIAPHRIVFGVRPLGVETLRGATITNTSGRDLSILVEGGLPDDFGFGLLPGSTCPALTPGGLLLAGESCRVVVRFTPSESFAGLRQIGMLTVALRRPGDNALLATRTIPVTGQGAAR
jgi:uncharacterized repeat protein (TIGR01451 family)